MKTSTGSLRSAVGVVTGEPVLNQKCFFLVGGLPEVRVAGESDADKGLFGRLIMVRDLSFDDMPGDIVESASAVRGRSGELIFESLEELITSAGRGVGLAMELMLPDKE
jgi:hypothetical protein